MKSQETALIQKEDKLESLKIVDCINCKEGMKKIPRIGHQVIVVDEKSGIIKLDMVLQNNVDSISNFKIIEWIVREYSGNTIKIIDIKQRSIILTLESSEKEIESFISRLKDIQLNQAKDFTLENMQILSKSENNAEKKAQLFDKWNLVTEIVNNPVVGRILRNVDLSDADLSFSDLRGADLRGADLRGADLRGTHLSFADLRSAKLRGAKLRGVKLRGAKLRNITIDEKTKLDRQWLKVQEIVDQGTQAVDLSFADLSFADLRDVDLRGANLSGVDFRGADLRDANLSDANLSGADLTGADLRNGNVSFANLKGVNLRNGKLKNADVNDTIFEDNQGICDRLKKDLIGGGAKFEEAPTEEEELIKNHSSSKVVHLYNPHN